MQYLKHVYSECSFISINPCVSLLFFNIFTWDSNSWDISHCIGCYRYITRNWGITSNNTALQGSQPAGSKSAGAWFCSFTADQHSVSTNNYGTMANNRCRYSLNVIITLSGMGASWIAVFSKWMDYSCSEYFNIHKLHMYYSSNFLPLATLD
jgi:hypothetical protein